MCNSLLKTAHFQPKILTKIHLFRVLRKYPIDLLKDAGVDVTSPEPVRTTLNKFSDLVSQLESITV